jgi:hypothetical protein
LGFNILNEEKPSQLDMTEGFGASAKHGGFSSWHV